MKILSNRGQILVEYILLLVIAVSCATLLTKSLVGRGEDSQRGIVVKAWDKMIKALGQDLPDCENQTQFQSANCPP